MPESLTTAMTEVDFRFACAKDSAEIIHLVNDAFSVEKGASDLAFTTRDRVDKEEVDACLNGAGGERRWLVLETPRPEEKMVVACLICTGSTPGTGSLEVLAVDPTRQREGLGSHMLRKVECILLNFRCRFIRMKVPQWREDVLEWAAKRDYNEIGGGVWGEMDGECAEQLTRPTRYFLLMRDLLADKKLDRTFGEGTPRFTAATAAAAKRSDIAHKSKCTSNHVDSTDVPWRAEGGSGRGRGIKDESGCLAGFLSTVLRRLAVEEGEGEGNEGRTEVENDSISAAPMADVAVGSPAKQCGPPEVPFPPLPPDASDKSGAVTGIDCDVGGAKSTSSTATAARSLVSVLNHELEVAELQTVGCGDGETEDDKQESVEDLLTSLMHTLNTEQGRNDFRLLAAKGSTS